MQILIVRDGGATKVPKEVASMADVIALRADGFEVEVVGGEPEPIIETVEYADGTVATGPGPLPEQSPAEPADPAPAQPDADAVA